MADQASERHAMRSSTGTLPDTCSQQHLLSTPLLTSPGTRNVTIPSPLPRSRVVLDASFSRPALRTAQNIPVEASVRRKKQQCQASQHLTRTNLQQDEHCAQSSGLRQLLGTIFAYSDRYLAASNHLLESTAGFCYFLPNGRLAYEWVHFFEIMPERYQHLAPQEVLYAFHKEREFVPYSMKSWVEDIIHRAEMKESDRLAKDFISNLTPVFFGAEHNFDKTEAAAVSPQSIAHKRKLEDPTESDGQVPDEVIDPQLLPSTNKRRRLAGPKSRVPQLQSSLGQPAITMNQAILPPRLVQTPQNGSQLARQTPHLAVLQAVHSGVVASQLQIAPLVVAGPVPPSVQAQPPTHVPQLPPQNNRRSISVARQARSHPAPTQAPGSVTLSGRGNVVKAWSPERIRAFTNIEGYSTAELPFTAVSQYGDEMSRNHTPASIDPRCCPFDTTMEENLTYMTLATTTNRELCARAKRYWTASDMYYYVYHVHDLRLMSSYGRTRLQKQFLKCTEDFQARFPQHVPSASMANISMDSGLNGDDKYPHDFFLHAMGENVVYHPMGRKAQMLTRVIREVLRRGDRNVRLSQAAQYAQIHNITVPVHELMSNDLSVADRPDPLIIARAEAEWVAKFPNKTP
jgi:hypothetical protein